MPLVESLFPLLIPRIRLVEDELSGTIPDETTGARAGPLSSLVAEGASIEALARMIAD